MFFIKTNKKITRRSFIIASSLFVCVFFIFTAIAAPDQELTYHGKLTDAFGLSVPNGSYDFTLSIYNSPVGGTCLWTARGTCGAPTPKILSVTNGIFSTNLGELGDNAINLAFDENYYLEITIGTNSPMSPRRKITPTGFALNAHRLNGLTADNFIDTSAAAQIKQGNLIIGGNLTVDGIFYDSNGHAGTSGQILSTTATGTDWITQTDGDVLAALLCGNDQVPQWNGSTWICATVSGGGMAIGDAITSATAGSVLFADATGMLAQDNTNFFWDNTNKRLGIGTNTPSANLTVKGITTEASLGAEQVINGSFDTDATGWTTSTWTWGTNRMNYTGTSGAIASVLNGGITLNNGGTGYTIGDVLTLTNGANDATVTVTSVLSGRIRGFTLTSVGTACTVNASVSTTGGTGAGANFTISRLVDSTNILSQNVSVIAGNTYQITYTMTRSAGEMNVILGGVSGHRIISGGGYTQSITATTTGDLIFTPTVDFVGSIDTISVKRVMSSASVASLFNSDGTVGMELRAGGSYRNNTFIGVDTGSSHINSGCHNTAIGYQAFRYNTTGFHNTASGAKALYSNTTGTQNTASGTQVLYSNTTGMANTASGYSALYSNTIGSSNTASGAYALRFNTIGSQNTALGYYALESNTTGSDNTASGHFALQDNTTGVQNAAFGSNSLYANTTGYGNTVIGYYALYSNTIGFANTASGAQTLSNNTTGNQNTASGYFALSGNTTGSNNTALGYNTGGGLITGSGNTILGANVSGLAADLTNNIILANGTGAIKAQYDGTNWNFIGNVGVRGATTEASLGAEQVTNGTFNTDASGWTATTWTWGTNRMNYTGVSGAIATVANGGITLNDGGTGYTNGDVLTLTNGANNATITVTSVSLGKITGFNLTAAGTACTVNSSVSTTGGTGAGASFNILRLVDSVNTLSQNVSVTAGNTYQVSYALTRSSGEINLTLGGGIGQKIIAGGTQVITATSTGNLIFTPTVDFTGSIDTISVKQITASSSVATLLNSNGTTGLEMRAGGISLGNSFVGVGSGSSSTTGISNIAFGNYALSSNSSGNWNTASGYQSLKSNTTASANTAFGYQTLYSTMNVGGNDAFGYKSLYANIMGYSNVAIGNSTLMRNTSGYENTAVGNNALAYNITGNDNTATGMWTLFSNTTGSNNTASGSFALRYNTTGSGNAALGYYALSGNTTGSNNSAVGNSALSGNTTGISNVAMGYASLLSNTTGSYNVAVGTTSLQSNKSGNNNTSVGYFSLTNSSTGTGNVAVGTSTLVNTTTGSYNTAMGYQALFNVRPTSAQITTFADAGSGNVTVTSANTLINGDSVVISGTTNYNGTYTVANCTASNFTIIHAFSITETGWWQKSGEGQYNTAVGYSTGNGITTGSGNTIIGAWVTGLASNLTNNIILANGTGAIKAQNDGTNWNLTNNVLPSANSLYSLGSGTFRWNTVYANNLSLANTYGVTPGSNQLISMTNWGIRETNFDGDKFIIDRYSGNSWRDGTFAIDRMTGFVGVGTINPQRSFVVAGTNPHVTLKDDADSLGWAMWDGGNSLAFSEYLSADWTSFAHRLVIANGGNVGIGTTTPSQLLTVYNGSTTGTYTTSGWAHSSDERLKTNITLISDPLQKVMALESVYFNWKKDPNNDRQIGFIAQDVMKVIPEVVVGSEKDGYGIAYGNLTSLLAGAVQQQQKLIQTNTNDLTLKANATSVAQLQQMTNDQFVQVSTLLRSTQNDDGTLRDDIEMLFVENANMRSDILDEVDIRIADRLQGMDEDFKTIMTFADVAQDIIVNADRLVRTDDDGGLTIKGVMVAGRVETDALVITGEEEGATIGSATIVEGAYDVFVPTTAVVQNSRIFVTPKRDVVTQTLSITRIDDDSGFHVTVAKPVDKSLEFDWMIVEDQVTREGQKHVDEVTDQKPAADVNGSNELVITAGEGIVN